MFRELFDLPRSSVLNKDLLLRTNPYKTLKNVHTKIRIWIWNTHEFLEWSFLHIKQSIKQQQSSKRLFICTQFLTPLCRKLRNLPSLQYTKQIIPINPVAIRAILPVTPVTPIGVCRWRNDCHNARPALAGP